VQFARISVYLFVSAVATAVWSIADRRRPHYAVLNEWLRVFVAFVLAVTMVRYGVQKVMVVQMSPLSPHQLLAPLGRHTPRQLLWAFMGAAPTYQMFTGVVEVLAGLLLFIPRLITLGALLTFAAMANVLALNVAYDVEVKLFAVQLLLMSAFLLLPDLPRIASVFILNRDTPPRERPRLFTRRSLTRAGAVLPLVLAVTFITLTVATEKAIDAKYGAPAPETVPFYGIWDVEEFVLDGDLLPPLTNDEVRWQRVIFDAREYLYVQRMSGSLIIADASVNTGRKTITLDHSGKPRAELKEFFGPIWKAEFTYSDSTPELLILTGRYENRPAMVKLRKSRSRFFLHPHERQWILRGMPVFPYV
jgi:hypothetical protein